MAAILAVLLALLDEKPHKVETLPKQESVAKVAARLPLVVSAWPEKTIVRPDKEVYVTMRVLNKSEVPQTFDVFNNAWYVHWRTDNRLVTWYTWVAGRNFHVPVTLMPGEAYERSLLTSVKQTANTRTTTFRMGFTSYNDEHNVYWSNEVVLGIAHENAKAAVSSPQGGSGLRGAGRK